MRIAWDNPLSPIHAQKLAVALLEYACGHSQGRGESDPVYRSVTEGRDHGAKYSSCGDLAHWLLYRLGVRYPWVNRREHGAGWRLGKNVSDLCWNRLAQGVNAELHVEPGDTLVIWNRSDGTDAHVLCVIDQDGGDLLTAEYGQPGGALRRRQVIRRDDGVYLGSRRIRRRLPLLTVLSTAQELGLLDDADDPREAP